MDKRKDPRSAARRETNDSQRKPKKRRWWRKSSSKKNKGSGENVNNNVVSINKKPESDFELLRYIPDIITDYITTEFPKKWARFKKTRIFGFFSALFFIFAAVYFLSLVLRVNFIPVKTENVVEQTVYDNVTAEFFIVRDEQFIANGDDGRVVPLVEDGDRVAKGDTIALIFSDDAQAADYARMCELEEEIKYYENFEQSAGINNTDLGHLNRQIQQTQAELLSAADRRDIAKISELSETLKNQLTKRQIITKQKVDFEENLKAYKEEYEKLKNKNLSFSEIKADRSGYYISQADGYESAIDYKNIDEADINKLNEVFGSNASAAGENKHVGKLVDGFNWYLLCSVDNETAKMVSEKVGVDNNVKIDLPFSSVNGLTATVKSVKLGGEEQKAVIILKCSQMSSEIAHLRREIGQLNIASYTGFKVLKENAYKEEPAHVEETTYMEETTYAEETASGEETARKEENWEEGFVYVLNGRTVKKKKFITVYEADDFLIVRSFDENLDKDKDGNKRKDVEESDYIHLNDKLIVEGKKLYDGKIV